MSTSRSGDATTEPPSSFSTVSEAMSKLWSGSDPLEEINVSSRNTSSQGSRKPTQLEQHQQHPSSSRMPQVGSHRSNIPNAAASYFDREAAAVEYEEQEEGRGMSGDRGGRGNNNNNTDARRGGGHTPRVRFAQDVKVSDDASGANTSTGGGGARFDSNYGSLRRRDNNPTENITNVVDENRIGGERNVKDFGPGGGTRPQFHEYPTTNTTTSVRGVPSTQESFEPDDYQRAFAARQAQGYVKLSDSAPSATRKNNHHQDNPYSGGDGRRYMQINNKEEDEERGTLLRTQQQEQNRPPHQNEPFLNRDGSIGGLFSTFSAGGGGPIRTSPNRSAPVQARLDAAVPSPPPQPSAFSQQQQQQQQQGTGSGSGIDWRGVSGEEASRAFLAQELEIERSSIANRGRRSQKNSEEISGSRSPSRDRDENLSSTFPSVSDMIVFWYGKVEKIGRSSVHSRVLFVTETALYVCLPTGGVTRTVQLADIAGRELFPPTGLKLSMKLGSENELVLAFFGEDARNQMVAAMDRAIYTLAEKKFLEPTTTTNNSSNSNDVEGKKSYVLPVETTVGSTKNWQLSGEGQQHTSNDGQVTSSSSPLHQHMLNNNNDGIGAASSDAMQFSDQLEKMKRIAKEQESQSLSRAILEMQSKLEVQQRTIEELRATQQHASAHLAESYVNEIKTELDSSKILIKDLQTALRAQENVFAEMLRTQEKLRVSDDIQKSLEKRVEAAEESERLCKTQLTQKEEAIKKLEDTIKKMEVDHAQELDNVQRAFHQYDEQVSGHIESLKKRHEEEIAAAASAAETAIDVAVQKRIQQLQQGGVGDQQQQPEPTTEGSSKVTDSNGAGVGASPSPFSRSVVFGGAATKNTGSGQNTLLQKLNDYANRKFSLPHDHPAPPINLYDTPTSGPTTMASPSAGGIGADFQQQQQQQQQDARVGGYQNYNYTHHQQQQQRSGGGNTGNTTGITNNNTPPSMMMSAAASTPDWNRTIYPSAYFRPDIPTSAGGKSSGSGGGGGMHRDRSII